MLSAALSAASAVSAASPASPSSAETEAESLCREILDRYEEINLLYRLGESLAGVLGTEEICWRVLQEAATITHARSGCVLLVHADGGFTVAAEAGEEARRQAETRHAVLTARPVLEDGDKTGRGSFLSVPLGRGGVGQIVLAERQSGSFTAGEQKLVSAVAAMAGIFIENGRLAQRMKDSERVTRELEIAREIQLSLLPATDPQIDALEIAGGLRAAGAMGGDYYGFIPLPDGRLGVVVADVMGHDIAAAIGMVTARSLVRVIAADGCEPADLLARLNTFLCEDLAQPGQFVTAFYAVIDPATGAVRYANAGHHPPMLLRASGDTGARLEGAGPGLGIVENACYETGDARLDPGDLMLLYTDGVLEARDGAGELYGYPRLRRLVNERSGRPVREIRDAVFDALAAFTGRTASEDDTTLVAVRRRRIA